MNGDTLTFAQPELAWLAVPAVLLVVWAAVQAAGWHKRLNRLGHGAVLLRVASSFSAQRTGWRIALWGLALLLLVVAATRPRYGMRETEVSNAGIDVALVVDASKSMLVKDVVPNRLKGTELEISALLSRLAGGRVALVPFAGIPFVQCPLTSDHEVVRTYLSDLKPEDLPLGGTNIGRAIQLAVEALTSERERSEAGLRDNLMPQFKGSKNKAIIVFSDGEDHEGAALDAARKAAELGIRVYTVGVGSAFGDPVPVLGPDGTATGILKDESGNPVFSKLNLDLMRQIAAAGGGKSLHYANKSVVAELFAELDALEKTEYQAQFRSLGEDRYQWLLGPALLLLLAELALGLRRRTTTATRVAVRAALVAAPILATCLLAAPASAGWLQRENPDIASGRELLGQKKHGEALQAFKQAQATRPEHALIWYDIGLAHAWLGQHAEAITALSRALAALQVRDAQVEADFHYALGTTQLQWAQALEQAAAAKPDPAKDGTADPPAAAGGGQAAGGATEAPSDTPLPHYKLAVQSLETALLADPTRVDVRRNLELARLGAYPPCASRDTQMEPNNQLEQAQAVTMAEGARETTLDLRMCPADRDLFKLRLEPGDRLNASVVTKADAQPIQDDSTAPQGKPLIGIQFLAADGQTVLQPQPAADQPQQLLALAPVAAAGDVLIDVRDHGEIETAYDLKVKVLPACQRIEDPAEPNDTVSAAKAVTVGEPLAGRLCPRNPDYFRVALQPGYGVKVSLKTTVDLGDPAVSLDVVDGLDKVLAHGVRSKDGMAVRLPHSEGGEVAIRVVGGLDTEADYQMAIEVLPPCAARDDAYEDNDQALTANPLDAQMLSKPLEQLQLCPGDDDWYAVDLQPGESLFADLGASVEEVPDAAELAGQLTVEVYDAKGQLWGSAVGEAVANGGSIVRTVAVLAPPPGRYRLRVTGGGVGAPAFPPEGMANLPPQPIAPGGLPPAAATAPPQQPPANTPPASPAPGQGGNPPVPQPIPHIALPPGTPSPSVERSVARLDLPYQLRLRILPACPAGNDEREPNDKPSEAKPIEVGSEQLLRLCAGDTDWLQLTQKAGQALQVSARYDKSHGNLALTAWDESGVKELAQSATVTAEEGKGGGKRPQRAPQDDSPAARKGRTAVQMMALPAPKADRVVKLRVNAAAGVENFYVLRIDEPPPSSDKGQQEQQEQQDKDKDKDKDPNADKDKQKDDKKDQPDPQGEPPPPTPQQEQLRRQMERNDHNPSNLEAEEALRKSPFKNARPDKDW